MICGVFTILHISYNYIYQICGLKSKERICANNLHTVTRKFLSDKFLNRLMNCGQKTFKFRLSEVQIYNLIIDLIYISGRK